MFGFVVGISFFLFFVIITITNVNHFFVIHNVFKPWTVRTHYKLTFSLQTFINCDYCESSQIAPRGKIKIVHGYCVPLDQGNMVQIFFFVFWVSPWCLLVLGPDILERDIIIIWPYTINYHKHKLYSRFLVDKKKYNMQIFVCRLIVVNK